MLVSEEIKLEQERRERGLREELLRSDQENHERAVDGADEQLAELRKIDKQLVQAVTEVSKLPAALQSRYGDGVSRALGLTMNTADARLSVLAILDGARRDVALKLGKVEAERDRRQVRLDQVRDCLASEFGGVR